jgi:acetyl esterase/lipase
MLVAASAGLAADTGSDRLSFGSDGTAHVQAFDLPPSAFMSKEAVDRLKARAGVQSPAVAASADIVTARRRVEDLLAPAVAIMRARYAVDIVEQTIAGVPARVVTPKGGASDKQRILINLHGGGFAWCADACRLLEATPIAATGGFKVISIDYRQAPEAVFPAASEDVAAVYRELLKSYKSSQIGIYGCSAGGSLSAQAAAWLPAHGLPQAGAIGIFGAGAIRSGFGDSNWLAPAIDGVFPRPSASGGILGKPPYRDYFAGADRNDPMISPAMHPEVLAKFPPTLIITGTRAPDLSAAVLTHSQLVKAGVPGDLIVGEGMDHCYINWANLPESQDAYAVIVKFFRDHLG